MSKVLEKENLAQVLKLIMCVLCCLAIIQSCMVTIPTPIYCNRSVASNTNTGNNTGGDLFDTGMNIISNAQEKLVEICLALCPLALIFVIVCVLVTHNEKKMAWYMQLGVIILVATAAVLIINSGVVIDTLQAWF